MEFAQGAVDIAIDEKKISCFPRHIGGGGLGLQSAIERRSPACEVPDYLIGGGQDRKSTRLNSSHQIISYAVFCLKKKTIVRTFVSSFVSFHQRVVSSTA